LRPPSLTDASIETRFSYAIVLLVGDCVGAGLVVGAGVIDGRDVGRALGSALGCNVGSGLGWSVGVALGVGVFSQRWASTHNCTGAVQLAPHAVERYLRKGEE
jgi:hypothetical protein